MSDWASLSSGESKSRNRVKPRLRGAHGETEMECRGLSFARTVKIVMYAEAKRRSDDPMERGPMTHQELKTAVENEPCRCEQCPACHGAGTIRASLDDLDGP